MDVTTETFRREVIGRSRELPVVVDFWAGRCGPCRMLGPALEAEAAKPAGRLELVKVDVDAEPQLSIRYGIGSIPDRGRVPRWRAGDRVRRRAASEDDRRLLRRASPRRGSRSATRGPETRG